MSPLAQDCNIRNPDVIRFRKNEDNTLTVYADTPIQLLNEGLGYIIRCDLQDFTFDFSSGETFYSGSVLFHDLSDSMPREAAAWRKARLDTYKGSFLHFKRSFYTNKLVSEGFEMHSLTKVVNSKKQRAKLWLSQQSHLTDQSSDSTKFYKRFLKQPDSLISHQLIPEDSVGFAADSTTAGFYFPDSLEVTYLRKTTPFVYQELDWHNTDQPHPVSQLVFVKKHPIYILSNGFHYQPEDVKITGFWSWWETMATRLPFDYTPAQ
jgi:hypothetical protein